MEEDIKILEKYLDIEEGAFNIWKIETINECEDLRVAIENLIARNKELEGQKEAINKKRKEIEEQLKGFQEGKYISLKVNELYIPKSKIKQILYPTPENPIELEIQNSKMYKKLLELIGE